MHCEHCGARLGPQARFCAGCGGAVSQRAQPAPAALVLPSPFAGARPAYTRRPASAHSFSRRRRRPMKTYFLFLLLVGALVLAYFQLGPSLLHHKGSPPASSPTAPSATTPSSPSASSQSTGSASEQLSGGGVIPEPQTQDPGSAVPKLPPAAQKALDRLKASGAGSH